MTRDEAIKTLEKAALLLPMIQEAQSVLMAETVKPTALPNWKKGHLTYEEPCLGSAFERSGRRYIALYMGRYYIDIDELYELLPKEEQK